MSQTSYAIAPHLCSANPHCWKLSKLAADCGLNEGIAFCTVEIGQFQINIVPTIFTDHGQAD